MKTKDEIMEEYCKPSVYGCYTKQSILAAMESYACQFSKPLPSELPEFSQYMISEINGYQHMRDGWKEGTQNYEAYDLMVRELRKIADKYLQDYCQSSPLPEGKALGVKAIEEVMKLDTVINTYVHAHGTDILHEIQSLFWAAISAIQKLTSPVQVDGWISVEERLPEKDGDSSIYCLCYDKNHREIKVHPYNEYHKCWDQMDGDDYYTTATGGAITHWQPLPKSPAG